MIKLIGAVSMLIDHVGFVFFPTEMIFRAIGRLAFPLFAFQVAISCEKTTNIVQYIKRLAIWALIAQAPYMLLFGMQLNVLVTFLLAVILLFVFKEKGAVFFSIALLPMVVIAHFGKVDFGIYGVLIVIAFYFLRKKRIWSMLTFILLTFGYTIYMFWQLRSEVAFIYLLAVLPIPLLKLEHTKIHTPKYFFYIFYPSHFLVLWVISKIL